ncbi:MAG: hypothetical protein Q7S27_03990 [Nanoarchaeota archaeon]|nr:hypothetical protein [Nanoarchaeota archaeon]
METIEGQYEHDEKGAEWSEPSGRASEEALRRIREDREWFEANFQRLRAKYGRKVYIAIHAREVLATDRSIESLQKIVLRNYDRLSFYLGDLRKEPITDANYFISRSDLFDDLQI